MAVAAGSVWVGNYNQGTLVRIDPATLAITARYRVGGQPRQLAVSLWVANHGTVSRIVLR